MGERSRSSAAKAEAKSTKGKGARKRFEFLLTLSQTYLDLSFGYIVGLEVVRSVACSRAVDGLTKLLTMIFVSVPTLAAPFLVGAAAAGAALLFFWIPPAGAAFVTRDEFAARRPRPRPRPRLEALRSLRI